MPGVAFTIILFVIVLIILPGVRVVRQFERGVSTDHDSRRCSFHAYRRAKTGSYY